MVGPCGGRSCRTLEGFCLGRKRPTVQILLLPAIIHRGIVPVYLDFQRNYLYPEVMRPFDDGRQRFAPYGLTCQIWEPARMPRPDRHDEIEINLLEHGGMTYILGGEWITVRAGEVTAVWAAVPHQIVDFNDVTFYYAATVPLSWVLGWGSPGGRDVTIGTTAGPDRLQAQPKWEISVYVWRPANNASLEYSISNALRPCHRLCVELVPWWRTGSAANGSAEIGGVAICLCRAERGLATARL